MKMSWTGIFAAIVAAMFLLATPMAFAQEAEVNVTGEDVNVTEAPEVPEVELPETAADPGIAPDSPIYGLDVAFDQLSLWIAGFAGPKAHALRGLEIAQERIAEAKAMAEQRKFEAMVKAETEHGKMMVLARGRIKDVIDPNATAEIEQKLEIEKALVAQKEEVEAFREGLKIKIEIEGNITAEQEALINETLGNLEGQVGEVEIEIENEKEKTKIKIKAQTNLTDEEIEVKVKNIGRRVGLIEMTERAAERIAEAEEKISEVKAMAEEANVTRVAVLTLIERAQFHLEEAQAAFAEEKYGMAVGRAKASEKLAKSAERLIEGLEEVEERLAEIREKAEEKRARIRERMEEKRAEIEEKAAERLNKTKEEIAEKRAEILGEIEERRGRAEAEIECITDADCEEDEVCVEGECEEAEELEEELEEEPEEGAEEELTNVTPNVTTNMTD